MHQQQQEYNWELRNESKDSWEWGRNTVRDVGWGMIRSTEERGNNGGEEVTKDDAGFNVHQLCVQKHEVEERTNY